MIENKSLRPKYLSENLEAILKDEYEGNYLTLSFTTSAVLRRLGLNDGKIVIPVKKLLKGLLLDGTQQSGHRDTIDKNLIIRTSEEIGDPIVVFQGQKEDTLICVYDFLDRYGEEDVLMLAAITKDKTSITERNVVLTIFGKHKIPPVNKVIYYDDERLNAQNGNLSKALKTILRRINRISPSFVLTKSKLSEELESNRIIYSVLTICDELKKRKNSCSQKRREVTLEEIVRKQNEDLNSYFFRINREYRKTKAYSYEMKEKYRRLKRKSLEYYEYGLNA